VVTIRTTCCNFNKFCVSIYASRISLTINCDCFTKHYAGCLLCNEDTVCLHEVENELSHGIYTNEYIGSQTGDGVRAGPRVFGRVNGNFDEKLRGTFPGCSYGLR
jgi:hypothetical protein